jgi:Hydrazine synthase alpha subunit middle domain
VPKRKLRINRASFLTIAMAVGCDGALCATVAKRDASLAYVFTATPRYEAKAWLEGRDRFPFGAKLVAVVGGMLRLLAPGFSSSADAAISYDGSRVLFSGKRDAADHWQIWEVDLQGGAPRQITRCASDCIRPLYLPDGEIVYSRGDGLEIGGKTGRVTFAPGRYLTDDVLRDGRILFEAGRGARSREIFTVYPDGTGVESLRCDHGPDRGDARQLASGDYIFVSGNRLARITSALASQTDVFQPDGEPAGPIAEVSPGVWLVSLRAKSGNFGLYRWDAATRQTVPLETPANASAVEPVVIAPRTPPKQFPSALVPTRTAGNLLCLNSRASRMQMNGSGVRAVKVYTGNGLLGQTEVEPDGSFYIQVPADRPIRMELVDAMGRVVEAEHNWFWMRPAEQRICVGCHLGPERAPENKVPDILVKTIVPVKMLEVQGP